MVVFGVPIFPVHGHFPDLLCAQRESGAIPQPGSSAGQGSPFCAPHVEVSELMGGIRGDKLGYSVSIPAQEQEKPTTYTPYTPISLSAEDVNAVLAEFAGEPELQEAICRLSDRVGDQDRIMGYIRKSNYSFEVYSGEDEPNRILNNGRPLSSGQNFERIEQDYVYDDPDAKERKIVAFKTSVFSDRKAAGETMINLIDAFLP